MVRVKTEQAGQGQAQCRAGPGQSQQGQARGLWLSKGMCGRTRIHAGQPYDKPRTGLY